MVRSGLSLILPECPDVILVEDLAAFASSPAAFCVLLKKCIILKGSTDC